MPNSQGRCIPLQVNSPAENMAIDHALLESVDAGSPAVLRLYTWREPTLSLGYFQRIAERSSHSESSGLSCVRRATGGGAIVHHHELTYSIVVPVEPLSKTVPKLDLYRQTHLAVVDVLSEFGVRAVPFRMTGRSWMKDPKKWGQQVEKPAQSTDPFLCFQRRSDEDLIVCGYKVLGSAQRKTRRAILQHGSLLLRTSQWAPQIPGICDLTSRWISPERFAERFAAILGDKLGIDWISDAISAAEHRRAAAISTQKFASQRWLSRR